MYQKLIQRSSDEIMAFSGKPYYMYVSTTNVCNAYCTFCDVHEQADKHSQIDLIEVMTTLRSMGTEYLHFTGGGEPFADKNIWTYFEHATNLGLSIAVTSNGGLLTESKIEQLAQSNVSHMFFSIDSHSSELHNQLRGVKRLWEKVTENIRTIKTVGPEIKIVVNHILNKENIYAIEKMIRLKETVPFDFLNPLLIKGCDDLYFTREQIDWYNTNWRRFDQLAAQLGVAFLYDNINLFEKYGYSTTKIDDRYLGTDYPCYFPQLAAYIDCPTGAVYPCDCTVHRDPEFFDMGNLRTTSFEAIWEGLKAKTLREKLVCDPIRCKENCDLANFHFNTNVEKSKLYV